MPVPPRQPIQILGLNFLRKLKERFPQPFEPAYPWTDPLNGHNFGRNQNVPRAQAAGEEGPLIDIAQVTLKDEQAQALTLTCSPLAQDISVDVASFRNPFIKVIVEWGSAGSAHTAEISLYKGFQVTVFGSYVRVKARNDVMVHAPTVGVFEQVDVRVACCVSMYPMGRREMLPWLMDHFPGYSLINNPLAIGASLVLRGIMIPNFARTLTIYRVDNVTGLPGAIRLAFIAPSGFSIQQQDFAAGVVATPEIVVPTATQQISIENLGPNAQNMLPQYGLAI